MAVLDPFVPQAGEGPVMHLCDVTDHRDRHTEVITDGGRGAQAARRGLEKISSTPRSASALAYRPT
jgi:hypothetical protein